MTVQLEWPTDVVDGLTEEARKRGLSLDAYLLEAVLHTKGVPHGDLGRESEKRRARAEAAMAIRELRSRVKPDPEGWTSRDYINYGRR